MQTFSFDKRYPGNHVRHGVPNPITGLVKYAIARKKHKI